MAPPSLLTSSRASPASGLVPQAAAISKSMLFGAMRSWLGALSSRSEDESRLGRYLLYNLQQRVGRSKALRLRCGRGCLLGLPSHLSTSPRAASATLPGHSVIRIAVPLLHPTLGDRGTLHVHAAVRENTLAPQRAARAAAAAEAAEARPLRPALSSSPQPPLGALVLLGNSAPAGDSVVWFGGSPSSQLLAVEDTAQLCRLYGGHDASIATESPSSQRGSLDGSGSAALSPSNADDVRTARRKAGAALETLRKKRAEERWGRREKALLLDGGDKSSSHRALDQAPPADKSSHRSPAASSSPTQSAANAGGAHAGGANAATSPGGALLPAAAHSKGAALAPTTPRDLSDEVGSVQEFLVDMTESFVDEARSRCLVPAIVFDVVSAKLVYGTGSHEVLDIMPEFGGVAHDDLSRGALTPETGSHAYDVRLRQKDADQSAGGGVAR